MNPLAGFVTSTIVALALLLTLSPAAALFVFVVDISGLIVFVAVKAIPASRLVSLLWPLGLMAVLSAGSTVLYGRPGGEVFFTWGLVCISQGSLYLAATIGLRILAIGIPAVVLAAVVDPTNLADSLTQLWRAPRRFVMGTLAAFRLLSLFVDDWHHLEMARRARGLGSGRGPVAAVARFGGQAFALLVLSIRRASALALAMDARGVNNPSPSRARTAEWKLRDWGFVTLALAISCVALVIAAFEQAQGGAF
ncbi:MAG: hypothetical protein RLZZ600_49 [Actinomycetota bacterium]|jgi:energy-coupling factor transport system permease protein